jgi:TfoX/Sxy family transcriptional regulator of competence genes
MSKTSSEIPKEKLDLYDKLIETNPDIVRKGVSMPYTSTNGHMFTILSKGGSLGMRLPKDEREAFLEKYNTTLHEAHGRIMKEYVRVPDNLLENTEELKAYLNISYAYVKSLKPKPTKKKSK